MKVSHFSVKHPTIISMLLIALMAFAGYAYSELSLEFMSDISLPTVQIITLYPGASAEDVESDVTDILEDDFVTLPNYKSMTSTSNNSYSVVQVTFNDGIDPYDQLEEIRYRISQLLDDLPSNILGQPSVMVGGADMLPIMTISVDAGSDIGRVSDYVTNDLKPKFNQIAGVSSVTVRGTKELRVNVKLRLDDLAAKGISVVTVYKSLQAGNVKLPIGTGEYEGKTIDIRYEGDFATIDDIKGLPVGVDDNNVIIRMKDVADVTLDYETPDYYVDGEDGEMVVVEIAKRSGGNIMNITNTAKEIMAEETEKSGGALKFQIVDDQSKITQVAINTVLQSGVEGLIFAILVIALFLGDFRSTMIISISIPISILFTFIGMKITGMTVNILSIAGLVVALGMIVDGSIVMIEQVFKYYSKREKSLDDCIYKGSDEVGVAIFASAVTTVVVYVPILFLQGLLGQVLHDVSLVLILAISGSFVAAVIIVPYLMKHILKEKKPEAKQRAFDKFMEKVEKGYRSALKWSMSTHRYVILLACSVLLVTLFVVKTLGFTYLPSVDMNSFDIELEYPQGYSLDQTRAKTLKAMDRVKDEIPEIDSYIVYSGNDGQPLSPNIANKADLHILLTDKVDRKRDIHEIILLLQKDLSANIPDCTVTVTNGGFDQLLGYVSGGGGYGITLAGDDMDLLYSEAERLETEMKSDASVVSTSINTDYNSSTLQLDMNHDFLSSVGANSYEAGITSIILFSGLDSGKFHSENGEQYDIRITSDMTDNPITPDSVAKMQIVTAAGENVSFANLGDIDVKQSISTVNHTDRKKTVTVSAKLISEDASIINTHVNRYLKDNPLADGITTQPGGIMDLISKTIKPMLTAIIIAFFLVYTVMVLQFEKFKQPLIVMFTIPFCLIGVILGLMAFGSTISMIAVFGLLSLGGIVVNNGIILIDYFNTKRSALPETVDNLKAVVVRGSASRLRPILMTSLSTMLGVIPMAFSHGEGSELYAPLGQAIAGGLFTSTLLTLFVVPTVYYVTERLVLFNKEKKALKEGTDYRFETGLPGLNMDGSPIEDNSDDDEI